MESSRIAIPLWIFEHYLPAKASRCREETRYALFRITL
jgi:hypothetical protein